MGGVTLAQARHIQSQTGALDEATLEREQGAGRDPDSRAPVRLHGAPA
jgi:hypothetical protein